MYFFSKQKSISVWSVSNWLEYPFFEGETTRILSPHGPLVVIDKSVAVSKIFSFSCRVSSPSPFLPLSLSLSSHLHSIPSFFSSGHRSWLSFPLPACTSQRCVQAAPTQRWALKRVPFGQKYLGPHVGATLLKSEENMESVCLNRIAQGQGVLGNFLDLQLGAEGELKII